LIVDYVRHCDLGLNEAASALDLCAGAIGKEGEGTA
jgi:hypothetical protein